MSPGIHWRHVLALVSNCPVTPAPDVWCCADLAERSARYEGEIVLMDNIILGIERRRMKYPHIDDGELQRRREAVQALRADLNAIKSAMGTRQLQSKIEADRKQVWCHGGSMWLRRALFHVIHVRTGGVCVGVGVGVVCARFG